MAKKSMIQRELKRIKLNKKYSENASKVLSDSISTETETPSSLSLDQQ